MASRVLPALLALALAGDAAPVADPFEAALLGMSGPEAVEAPPFDPDLAAVSWTMTPRREIVDALAARMLRGEAGGAEPGARPEPPALPTRIPADFDPGKVVVADRLAARVPADAAAVFFGSLREAEDAVAELATFLAEALPGPCGDPPGGRRDALRRAADMLLLPTIWRSNPGVRTGTRQVALVVSDPDLRWAPDVALLCEVDDGSLVRFHRRSSLSWEDRGNRRIRVEGLDAAADDGSIRSYFAEEGGIALWSTTRSLRERILAAGVGNAPSLLSPPAREYALARRTFPAAGGGALLVVPDGFLARIHAPDSRARRAAALRCEAARLILDARSLAGSKDPMNDTVRLSCPSGGVLAPRAGAPGASCSLHGTAEFPVPLGDLPSGACGGPALPADPVTAGGIPVAARWDGKELQVLVPGGEPGASVLGCIVPADHDEWTFALDERVAQRLRRILGGRREPERAARDYAALCGLAPRATAGREIVARESGFGWKGAYSWEHLRCSALPGPRIGGGVLRVGAPRASGGGGGLGSSFRTWDLRLEWR